MEVGVVRDETRRDETEAGETYELHHIAIMLEVADLQASLHCQRYFGNEARIGDQPAMQSGMSLSQTEMAIG